MLDLITKRLCVAHQRMELSDVEVVVERQHDGLKREEKEIK